MILGNFLRARDHAKFFQDDHKLENQSLGDLLQLGCTYITMLRMNDHDHIGDPVATDASVPFAHGQ